MTTNDFLSKRMAVSEFYRQYLKPNGAKIAEASKEPLKLRDMEKLQHAATLPTKEPKVVRCGTALCYYCLEDLISRYTRPTKPSKEDVAFMAKIMMEKFDDWSVIDLPTFVNEVTLSRIPSLYGNHTDYALLVLDFSGIMGKVESYDQMRPNKAALQGSSPLKAPGLQPIQKEHYHQLLDGTPYDFSVPYEDYVQGYSTPSGSPIVNAERYWRSQQDKNDEHDQRFFINSPAFTGTSIVKELLKHFAI